MVCSRCGRKLQSGSDVARAEGEDEVCLLCGLQEANEKIGDNPDRKIMLCLLLAKTIDCPDSIRVLSALLAHHLIERLRQVDPAKAEELLGQARAMAAAKSGE